MHIFPVRVSDDLTIDAVYIRSISEYEDIFYTQNRLCVVRNELTGFKYLHCILVDYCIIPEADELLKLHHIECETYI